MKSKKKAAIIIPSFAFSSIIIEKLKPNTIPNPINKYKITKIPNKNQLTNLRITRQKTETASNTRRSVTFTNSIKLFDN
jgi:hypothetical protein